MTMILYQPIHDQGQVMFPARQSVHFLTSLVFLDSQIFPVCQSPSLQTG